MSESQEFGFFQITAYGFSTESFSQLSLSELLAVLCRLLNISQPDTG